MNTTALLWHFENATKQKRYYMRLCMELFLQKSGASWEEAERMENVFKVYCFGEYLALAELLKELNLNFKLEDLLDLTDEKSSVQPPTLPSTTSSNPEAAL